jgi:GNAT superfamily N-acetyltransferase
MKIVRARFEDAASLTEIAHAAKRHWGYPEAWVAAWRDTLTMQPQFITANASYVAVENGRSVGFYVLTKDSDGAHLDHLWVLPSSMGRGIGRALFEHAATEVKRLGFLCMKIEADPNAETFYKHMGAIRVGTRISQLDGQRRELPLLEFWIDAGRTNPAHAR